MKTQGLLEELQVPQITGNALEDQRNWELYGIEMGRRKVAKDLEHATRTGGYQTRTDAQKVTKGALPLVALRILRWIDENTKGQGEGRSHSAVPFLKMVDPDVLALIALSSVFAGIGRKPYTIGTVAVLAGRQTEVAIEALKLEDLDPKMAKMLSKLIAKSSPAPKLKNAKGELKGTNALHDTIAARAGIQLKWDDDQRALVGGALLGCVLEAVPELFETKNVTLKSGGGYTTENSIVLTEEGAGYMLELQDALGWMNPKLLPMVAVPMDWDRFDTGAYRDRSIAKTVPLVRTRIAEQKRLIREALESGSMNAMISALNVLQRTKVRIDTLMKDVEEYCFENGFRPGGTDGSFPTKEPVESPERMSDEEWKDASRAKRKAIARRARTLRQIRMTQAADVGVFKSDMKTATWLAEQPCFYQPHTLDSRGRIYTAAHFGHQRSDHIKALFRFAEKKPLGARGGFWLMVHLANCGDFGKISKMPFDDRILWVGENEDQIIAAGLDPMDHYDFWSKADSPFLFLQACMEYTMWAAEGYEEGFLSDLPIALDGSCSGIQHYSAIMRSKEEGRHVNLLPREDVGDLYGVVASAALPMIQAQADPANYEAAKAALMAKKETKTRTKDLADLHRRHLAAIKVLENAFGRGTAKRNVMTYAYSAPEQGMRGQQMEDLMDPLQARVDLGEIGEHPYALEIVDKDHERFGEADGGSAAAACIAHHVYHATVNTLPRAQKGMEWFQTVAGILASEEKSVVWRTPVGFPVVSRYNEWETKQVNLWLYDRNVPVLDATKADEVTEDGKVLKRIRAVLRTNPKMTIDRKSARSAIAPNVIHSLDASHVFKTIELAVEKGITSFLMIHDSFATHAGDTEEFFYTIRVAFARLYEDYCPFKEIDGYARSVLSPEAIETLPPIPEKGDLDLLDVIGSLYAFA